MFKNPGEKLSFLIKALFWILSIVYATFAISFAVINSLFLWMIEYAISSASSSFIGTLSGASNTSSFTMIPFIIWCWAVTLVSIPIVMLILYMIALLFLTLTDTNKDMKESKKAIDELNNAYFTEGWFTSDMQTLPVQNRQNPPARHLI